MKTQLKNALINSMAKWILGMVFVISGSTALGTPNLTPYQPSGWSDKIVVARTTGTTTDSTGLTTADTLYVNWAVINNGTTVVTSTFYTYLYVDGVYKTYWTTASLNAGFFTYANDYSIGSLSAGTHTVTITTDATGTIAESNESDNSYTKTITVSNPGLPNLTPYEPSGWSDKIVVARSTGTTTDSTGLTTADTLYVNWAVINNGNATASGTFYTYLYVDGAYVTSWSTASLNAGLYTYVNNYSIGSLSVGTHTIEIYTDATGVIGESNESDNYYTKTITVSNPAQPNLTPYQPSGWSDKIVVARTASSTTDSTSLTTADTLYVNAAVINDGAAATAVNFQNALFVDGVEATYWVTVAPLNVNSYSYLTTGYSIGTLSAGSHTIKIIADYGGVIAESDEGDNSYTKTITVNNPPQPNLAPYQPSGWSDKIIVARTASSTTDSDSLTTADTLYVNAAVINNGAAATAANFNNEVYVDGVPTFNWITIAPLNVNSYSHLTTGYSIGQLSAGTHTIEVVADYGGAIAESNEGDNTYNKTITVTTANLPAPTLTSPANGSTGQSTTPTFSWSSVSGASSYRIMVATNAADLPSDPTAGSGGPSVVTNTTTTVTSFTPSIALNVGTTYYWEVHGRSATQYGTWSSVDSFTTIAPSIRISPLTLNFTGSASSIASQTTSEASASPQNSLVDTSAWMDSPVGKLVDAQEIYQGFNAAPTTKVIVHLARAPKSKPLIDFSSTNDLSNLRTEIKGVQDSVLGSVAAGDVVVRHRFQNISAFSAEVTPTGLEMLLTNSQVTAIEPVYPLHADLAQGIPLIHGMTYRSSYNGAGMAIAICDTGVDYNHSRLGGGGFPNNKVIGGYNFGDGNADPIPDGQAHGTACAGIAAGDLGTVGDYIGGVAYNAKIYALKITQGANDTADNDTIAAAWDWCVTHKNDNPNFPIMVISTSFSGGRYTSVCDSGTSALTIAANNAVATGITVLASAGNDGYCDSIGTPACNSSVISVGAVYDAAFGIYDPCVNADSCVQKYSGDCSTGYYAVDNTAPDEVPSYSDSASFLTLLAPANQCYTLDISGAPGYTSGDYYDSFGGTSAACPYAAGAVACLQAAAKALTGSYLSPQEVKSRLTANGDNITDPKSGIGKPRINLERAIQSLPASGQTFRIYNDGTGTLTVNSISPDSSAPWISFGPAGPFDIAAGGYQDVTVAVNFGQAPLGQSNVRLLVNSTDISKSPYPGGVFVQADNQTVTKSDQTITFTSLANKTIGEPPFAVNATASSGLPVSFAILSGPATISGNTVTITGIGTVTVRASQSGNTSYNPAPDVDQPFSVYQPPQLGAIPSGIKLVVSWPTNVTGYVLQSTTNLTPVVTWSTASPAPIVVNGRFTITNNATSGDMFYRLQK